MFWVDVNSHSLLWESRGSMTSESVFDRVWSFLAATLSVVKGALCTRERVRGPPRRRPARVQSLAPPGEQTQESAPPGVAPTPGQGQRSERSPLLLDHAGPCLGEMSSVGRGCVSRVAPPVPLDGTARPHQPRASSCFRPARGPAAGSPSSPAWGRC